MQCSLGICSQQELCQDERFFGVLVVTALQDNELSGVILIVVCAGQEQHQWSLCRLFNVLLYRYDSGFTVTG